MKQIQDFDELLNFIYKQKFKQIRANEMTQKDYQKLIKAIQILPIDQKFFSATQALIKYYGSQILIFFEKPYKKAINNQKIGQQYKKQFKKIGKLVRNRTLGKKIQQIQFFYFKGKSSELKDKQISPFQLALLDYLQKLSLKVKQLKEYCKKKPQKHYQESKKEELIDQILSMRIERSMTLNEFQLRFQNHIKRQVQMIFDQKIPQKTNQKQEKLKNQSQEKNASQSKQKQFSSQDQNNQKQKQFFQQKQSKKQSNNGIIQKPRPKKYINEETLDDLSQIPICCRKFFYLKQIIYQPQSLTIDYKFYNFPFKQDIYKRILKNICGLLNVEGGNLFIGILSDKQTFKRQITRYVMLESQKIQFTKKMSNLIATCILPSISHDMYKIMFVPIKNKQTNQYISGEFIIKIWVKYGLRNQVYSYKQFPQSKKEWFSFKAQNEVRVIQSCQQILKITKQRFFNPQPQPLPPFHQGSCQKPDNGRPLYQFDNYQKASMQYQQEHQEKNNSANNKSYKQKYTPFYQNLLVIGLSQISLRKHLMKICNLKQTQDFNIQFEENDYMSLRLNDEKSYQLLADTLKSQYNGKIQLQIVTKIIKSFTAQELLQDIISSIKNYKAKSIQCKEPGVITFKNIHDAVLFFIKLRQMGQKPQYIKEKNL